MDELPPIKSPEHYTGRGLEIIGSHQDSDGLHFSLMFQDGRFVSVGLPVRTLVSSKDDPETIRKNFRRYRATRLAETLTKDPSATVARAELKAIRKACREARPEEKGTNSAVKKILAGKTSTNWSHQDKREQAAISAIMELARELGKPPREWEVIDRMKSLDELIDGNRVKILQDSDTKNLAAFLRQAGFPWLERRKRGYRGER